MSLFPRRSLAFLRRVGWRVGTLLRWWASPESNPFLQRTLRVETRKYQALKVAIAAVLSSLILFGFGWWGWDSLFRHSFRETRNFPESYTLPRAIGGDLAGAAALLTLLCCAVTALLLCGTRAAQNLRREVLGGTLDQLQLLPQREERWLWLLRAGPLSLSLLSFLCGLPIFLLALFTGHWSLLDLFGLLLLFIFIGHAAPQWTPVQWQAQQDKARRFDLKAWQEALKSIQQESKGLKGEAAQLETQRRMARLWEKMEPTSVTSAPGTPQKTLVALNALPNASGAASNNWRGGWFMIFPLFGPLSALFSMPGSPLRAFWLHIVAALPPGVLELAPGFIITWPLLIARVLLAPLPFFAVSLPPMAIYIPLWVAMQIGGNLQLASNVSSSETFWTKRRLRVRRACSRAVFLSIVLMLIGYGWSTLIVDGVLAMAVLDANLTVSWALAALWTLCLIAGAVGGGEAQEKFFTRGAEGELPLLRAWKGAARIAGNYLLIGIAIYQVFCLLGAQWPVDTLFLQRLGPTLGTALAFWLADFGAGALQSTLPPAQRASWKALRFGLFGGLVLVVLCYFVIGLYYKTPFSFDQAPYVVLSPFVTIFALLRADLNGGVAWWLGPALQSVMGILCFSVALFKVAKAKATSVVEASEIAAENDDLTLPGPLRWLMGIVTGFFGAIVAFFSGVMEVVRRVESGVVRWSQKFDNPILTDDVKRRIHREHWPVLWLVFPLVGTFLWVQFWWLSSGLFKPRGIEIAMLTLGVLFLMMLFSSLRLGATFDRDRANGTLVFLFLTPLDEREIIGGKLRASLIFSLGLLGGLLPFLVIACVMELLTGNWLTSVLIVLGLVFVLGALAYFSSVALVCSTLSRKPGSGLSNTFTASFAGLMLLLGLLMVILFLIRRFTPLPEIDSDTLVISAAVMLWCYMVAVSIACWHGALLLLRRQRYSESITRGKGAA